MTYITGRLWWKREREARSFDTWGVKEDWNFCGEQMGVEFAVKFIPARDAGAIYDLPWSCAKDDLFNTYEFDTYKKAENYIKKFYGSTGVDAIEKPEWKTV